MASPLILSIAFISLFLGLTIFFWMSSRKNVEHFNTTNLICWLLVALFPVLLIFSFFPDSSIEGTIKGFSFGGAIGAFIFIWWYGTNSTLKANLVDQLNATIKQLELEVETLRSGSLAETGAKLPTVLQDTDVFYYKFKRINAKYIALVTGDIRNVRFVDIWVNSENTNMQMARFYDRSISGIIRYLAAEKDDFGNVVKDIVANELSQKLGDTLYVQPATVIVTNSGKLQQTHNVKALFHVASVQGEVGHGYCSVQNLGSCIGNALRMADSENLKTMDLKTILFPLLGTGTARRDAEENIRTLLKAAVDYIERNPNSSLECIFFIARTDVDLDMCKSILDSCEELQPTSAPSRFR
jgi:O-acetyl-ADP-ribose deacetylase (regulator of RNase III)